MSVYVRLFSGVFIQPFLLVRKQKRELERYFFTITMFCRGNMVYVYI